MSGDADPLPASAPASPGNLRFILRAFRSRNYRLYFAGQLKIGRAHV